MSRPQNFFDCLGLPTTFEITPEVLDQAYHKVLRVTHPDRFVGRTGAEKVAASLQAAQANEAYQTLKSFYGRACSYLAAKRHSFDEKTSPAPAFLMQVMEYQETLEEGADLSGLCQELARALKSAEAGIKEAFKSDSYETAIEILSQYKYLQRLVAQANAQMKAQTQTKRGAA